MNKRKTLTKLFIVLIFIMLALIVMQSFTYATSTTPTKYASIIDKADKLGTDWGTPETEVATFFNTILGYIQIFAIAITLATIIYYGIQLVSSESADRKQEIKTRLLFWVIGGTLIFGATKIVSMIITSTKSAGVL